MAAFVVSSTDSLGVPHAGTRLSLFPGSATPAVFPACAPFWIGYGFVPEPGDRGSDTDTAFEHDTRFELDVDGAPVELATDVSTRDGHPVSKQCVASFGSGLPVGWHRFAGRWYDRGQLVLATERSIEFLER
jgi:hypothetical protein